MNTETHQWTHVGFTIKVRGQTFTPYLASEGVWRVQQNGPIRTDADGFTRNFTNLESLVAAIDREIS